MLAKKLPRLGIAIGRVCVRSLYAAQPDPAREMWRMIIDPERLTPFPHWRDRAESPLAPAPYD